MTVDTSVMEPLSLNSGLLEPQLAAVPWAVAWPLLPEAFWICSFVGSEPELALDCAEGYAASLYTRSFKIVSQRLPALVAD